MSQQEPQSSSVWGSKASPPPAPSCLLPPHALHSRDCFAELLGTHTPHITNTFSSGQWYQQSYQPSRSVSPNTGELLIIRHTPFNCYLSDRHVAATTLIAGQRGDCKRRLQFKLNSVILSITGDMGSISSAVTVKTRERCDQTNLVSD